MPIIKSARKRVRVTRKATARNVKTKRSLKTALKSFHSALSGNKKTSDAHKKAQSALDKAAKKGIVHKNKVARKKRQPPRPKLPPVSARKLRLIRSPLQRNPLLRKLQPKKPRLRSRLLRKPRPRRSNCRPLFAHPITRAPVTLAIYLTALVCYPYYLGDTTGGRNGQ
jgi:small subunit ribosomal protein S20